MTASGTNMLLGTPRAHAFGEDSYHRLFLIGLSMITRERDIGSVELDVNGTAAKHRKVSADKMSEILRNHYSESEAEVKHDRGISPAHVEGVDGEVQLFMRYPH